MCMKTRITRVSVALGAVVTGLFAAAIVAVPATAAPVASAAAQVTTTDARDEDDCRVWVARRSDTAYAFCVDLRRGTEVTLKLLCVNRRIGFRYLAEESDRVRRGDNGRVRLSVSCRPRFEAVRAWVDVDRRGPRG
jgi:hypothetical protein